MLQSQQVEQLICLVSSLDRDSLIAQFHTYHASFPIDFTAEFLQNTPVERLRHIFLALCLQCQHLPDHSIPHAA